MESILELVPLDCRTFARDNLQQHRNTANFYPPAAAAALTYMAQMFYEDSLKRNETFKNVDKKIVARYVHLFSDFSTACQYMDIPLQ
jgi:hypothetical protein